MLAPSPLPAQPPNERILDGVAGQGAGPVKLNETGNQALDCLTTKQFMPAATP